MLSIATLGPSGSLACQAARQFIPNAQIKVFENIKAIMKAFENNEVQYAVIPVFNTREGEIKEYFRVMENLERGHWIDNIVLTIHLALGAVDERADLTRICGEPQFLRQAEDYISTNHPDIKKSQTANLGRSIDEIKEIGRKDHGFIGPLDVLREKGLTIREREVAPYNRTRFAVLGPEMSTSTGYDATTMITRPLMDRVGLLYDTLGEFSRRGINLLDLRSESDIKTQKMKFYIEAEGHINDAQMKQALDRIERQIIQEPGAIKILGSFPRVDMRTKLIRNVGFIGTGDMSGWFAEKLENEGYNTLLTGRNSEVTTEDMIPDVDVVVVCVPISATPATIERFGPKLKDGQALIILAGEAENALNAALAHCDPGVEIMLVHNLWGPQTATMKDKNASVVKTPRSGALCSEFESFLYKHGAIISLDAPTTHDKLMGFSQKLPTAISMAMALTLQDNDIDPDDIGAHSTLTSLYGVLAMCRIHSQNPRTYGEILASKGEGRKIVRDFAENLKKIEALAEQEEIEQLCEIMDKSRKYLTDDFLKSRMEQALAVDQTLGKFIET